MQPNEWRYVTGISGSHQEKAPALERVSRGRVSAQRVRGLSQDGSGIYVIVSDGRSIGVTEAPPLRWQHD